MSATASQPAQQSLWSEIREAIRGSHQDFTTGSLNRSIVLLAIPMVLEMVLESLFAVVDVFWVAHVGADAVATVGLTESLLTLVFAVGMGLSLSTTAMVARRIGEKDPEGAAVAAVQAIFLGLTVSFLIGVPCFIYAPELLRLMGASPEIVRTGTWYARIALGGGSGAVVMLFLNNAIFRGAGDAAIAMRLLWVSNIINLVLDPCLIFGLGPFPRLGVTGAAVATFTGRSIGVLYQFYRLMKGTERIRVLGRQIRLNARGAVAVAARVVHRHFSIRDREDELDRAGAHRQHFWRGGAGRVHDRDSHRDLRDSAFVGAEQCGGHAGGAESWREASGARGEIRVAHGNLQHAVSGRRGNRADCVRRADRAPFHERSGGGAAGDVVPAHREHAATSAMRTSMVMLQAFNGAGDTVTPTIVNFFGFWLFEIPLAYWLAIHVGLHSNGVYWSIVVAESAIAMASMILFRRGRWKPRQI